MTIPVQTYNELSPRVQAYAIAPLLKRHDAAMVFEKFGQTYVLPNHSSIVAKFRRYEALPLAITALVEGVTPSGNKPTYTDYTATLAEYGQFIPYTGFMLDTHQDPILKEYGSLCVQQAAESMETIRYNVLKGGSQVGYANGTRATVNTPISLAAQRVATAALWRQRGLYLTEVVSSSPSFRTEPIEAAFVAVCHPDVSNDIRNMQGLSSTRLTPSRGPMKSARLMTCVTCVQSWRRRSPAVVQSAVPRARCARSVMAFMPTCTRCSTSARMPTALCR